MKVQRQDTPRTSLRDDIGNQLGGNRRPRAGLAVLSRIAEIRDHGGHALGRSTTQGVDADQQLHQVIIGRKRGRLDDEHILAADVFLDLDKHLHVGKAPDNGLGQRNIEILADLGGKRMIAVAR